MAVEFRGLIDAWCFSHQAVFDLVTPRTVTCYASLSMGFSRKEYWSRLPFPTREDLPGPGIKPASLESPALAGRFFTASATWEVSSLCNT